MNPQNIGRALGIGVRVAGRIAGRRIAGSAQSAASPPRAGTESVASSSRPVIQAQSRGQSAGTIAAQTSRGVAKGIGGFLRPFRRIGGIVWLEVTGSFFLLFAAIFALRIWQNWSATGKLSRNVAIGAAVVFLYFGIRSFWQARRR